MTRSDLQWVRLSDFKPGIVHYLGQHVTGSAMTGYGPGALGMASIDATTNCIALPQGGIGPLPAQSLFATVPNFGLGSVAWAMQFAVFGPVVDPPAGEQAPYSVSVLDWHQVEMLLGFVGISGGQRRVRVLQAKAWQTTDPGGNLPRQMTMTVNTIKSLDIAGDATATANPIFFANMLMNPTTPTSLGNPTTIIGYKNSVTGNDFLIAWPDPTAPTTTTPVDLLVAGKMTSASSGWPVAHQSRLLVNQFISPARGTAATDSAVEVNDAFTWSQPNTWVLETSGVPASFTQEFPVGYGSWSSENASDLFLVKHFGGALLVQGDVNFPIVRRLPGVTSTRGAVTIGARGVGGYAYGVARDGIYAWQGGDGSRLLSPQMPPDFWRHSDTSALRFFDGGLSWWGDWLVVPNGFLYSASLDSWWHLTAPNTPGFVPYMWATNPMNNFIYGVAPVRALDDVSAHTAVVGWDRNLGARSFSWRSQPMFGEDPARIVTVREVIVVAQGRGSTGTTKSVQLTFVTETEGTVVLTFSMTGLAVDVPQVMRKTTEVRVKSNVRVLMVSSTNDETGQGAPIVYEVHFGIERRERVGPG